MELIFWISLSMILIIYGGYGILLWLANQCFSHRIKEITLDTDLPKIAIVIAAFNEANILSLKLKNTLMLSYPKEKFQVYLVTDGSNDDSNEIAKHFKEVKILWEPERRGKTAAINRAMAFIEEPITVFTDANVLLNTDALLEIIKHYYDPMVGGVSGEKRVRSLHTHTASSTEGIYWKYESFIKKQEATLGSLVGAAGELFSIRTSLFNCLPEDTLLDDFMISMNLIKQGYRVNYEPNAYACETPSLNIKEEYKRKVRIATGGIQSIIRLKELLSPFKYGFFSLQYFLHRVARWMLMPVLLMLAFACNLCLVSTSTFYTFLFILQILFYLLSLLGWLMEHLNIRNKLFYIPYYFNFMHICIVAGWVRYLRGNQPVTWEKSSRTL